MEQCAGSELKTQAAALNTDGGCDKADKRSKLPDKIIYYYSFSLQS
jgi:hypothetical protein